jgi:hypothetical protein
VHRLLSITRLTGAKVGEGRRRVGRAGGFEGNEFLLVK